MCPHPNLNIYSSKTFWFFLRRTAQPYFLLTHILNLVKYWLKVLWRLHQTGFNKVHQSSLLFHCDSAEYLRPSVFAMKPFQLLATCDLWLSQPPFEKCCHGRLQIHGISSSHTRKRFSVKFYLTHRHIIIRM